MNILILLIYIMVPSILSLVVIFNAKNNTVPNNTFKYPSIFAIVGVIVLFIISFAIFMIEKNKQSYIDENIVAIFIGIATLSVMFFMAIYVILAWLNVRIILEKEAFIYKNLFGKTKKYKYSDVDKVYVYYAKGTTTPEKYKIIVMNRRITVDYLMLNFFHFERTFKKLGKMNITPR